MENVYTCPVCGKTYTKLKGFSDCVNSHVVAAEKEDARQKAEQKQAEILALRTENETLVARIQKNIKKLKTLGINATIQYGEFGNRSNKKVDTNSEVIDLSNLLEDIFKQYV